MDNRPRYLNNEHVLRNYTDAELAHAARDVDDPLIKELAERLLSLAPVDKKVCRAEPLLSLAPVDKKVCRNVR